MILSKAQLSKTVQSEGFLGGFLRLLLKTIFFFMKNVLKPLAKTVLILLGLTLAASATDAGMHKTLLDQRCVRVCSFGIFLDQGKQIILIISDKEINDIMK